MRLARGFSRVELCGEACGLIGIGIELRAREAERVLGIGHVHAIDEQRERMRADFPFAFRVQQITACRALRTKTIGFEPGCIDDDTTLVTGRKTAARSQAPQVVRSGRAAHSECRLLGRCFADELDHAPRRIAVERREWAAQHFHALSRRQRETRYLPGTIGRARRNAIDQHFDATYAKAGARAISTRRNLQILRVVAAVLHVDTGNASECFGKIDLQLTGAQRVAIDDVDRRRNVEWVGGGASRGDNDGFDFLLRVCNR